MVTWSVLTGNIHKSANEPLETLRVPAVPEHAPRSLPICILSKYILFAWFHCTLIWNTRFTDVTANL